MEREKLKLTSLPGPFNRGNDEYSKWKGIEENIFSN